MGDREKSLSILQDMGFTRNRSLRALKSSSGNVEAATEWLLTKTDDASLDDPLSESDEEMPEASQEPKEEKKPLTEEERKEKLEKMEELRKQKRAEREEREKKEAIEKEKKRINEGKGMTEIKQQLAEQEIRKMAELRRREKLEEKAAKAKILAQIQEDKINRRAQFNMKKPEDEKGEGSGSAPAPAPAQPPQPKKDYTECRMQIRQTNGQALVHTFGAKEQLSAVRLYVQINRTDQATGDVKLMTNFPKRVFNDEDYDMTLEGLGLLPSAVLMIIK